MRPALSAFLALLVPLLVLTTSQRAEACSFACERALVPIAPVAGAASVPTNAHLVLQIPSASDERSLPVSVGRVDGGDGVAGVEFVRTALTYVGCGYLERLQPVKPLLANTQYQVTLVTADGGLPPGISERSTQFWTGANADLEPPAPPVVAYVSPPRPFCICGLRGGINVETESRSDIVWVEPGEPRFDTTGGQRRFSVPVACGSLVGLESGTHLMPVVALDQAWNRSQPTYVEVVSACDGIDPCTGDPIPAVPDGGAVQAPSSPQGCGCDATPTAAIILCALAFLVLRSSSRAVRF